VKLIADLYLVPALRMRGVLLEMRNAFKILVRKPEGKRPRGRPRHRWDYNIKINLK
jgi:hypothetical protein